MALIIFYILGLSIILLEEYLFGVFLGASVLSFYIIIIPIGAIVLGVFMGYILHLGMLKSRIPYGRLLILIAIIFGFFTYPSIRYMEYRTTYFTTNEITNSIDFNRKFHGDPISDLGISFINYEKQNLDYDEVTFTFKRKNSLDLPTNAFLNYLNYFFNWILMALSCIIIFKILAKNNPYCSNCRKYYREKLIFQFRPASYQNLIDELPQGLDNMEQLKNKYQSDVRNYRDYYQLYHSYCPTCKKGEFQIRHMVTEGNHISEAEKDRKTLQTS